jgi:hypothetical protein
VWTPATIRAEIPAITVFSENAVTTETSLFVGAIGVRHHNRPHFVHSLIVSYFQTRKKLRNISHRLAFITTAPGKFGTVPNNTDCHNNLCIQFLADCHPAQGPDGHRSSLPLSTIQLLDGRGAGRPPSTNPFVPQCNYRNTGYG